MANVLSDSSQSKIQNNGQKSPKLKIAITEGNESSDGEKKSYIWDNPNKPKAENVFLLKLDFFTLSNSCLAYFCKNLDQPNINDTYVSGMREAIGMEGSNLTYASNVFTAGYVLAQLPAAIVAFRVRRSILIPTLEVLWSVCAFCTASIKNIHQICVLRFLVGLCEGAFFPCIAYVIGSWYTKKERAKRVTLFYCTVTFSGIFSSYLQAAGHKNLNGVRGHAGRQWLFIICGIISLPIGVFRYFFNPDFPKQHAPSTSNLLKLSLQNSVSFTIAINPWGASAWTRTKIFKFAAYYLSYFSAGVPGIRYAWYPDLMPHDHEMRGFMIAASNMFSYINWIWYADAVLLPRARFGMAIVVRLLETRASKRRFSDGSDLETSNVALGEEKSAPVLVAGEGEVDGVKKV